MNQFCAKLKIRLTDTATAISHAAMPVDRPSPLFSVLNVLLNGGLLVWSFGVALDSVCSNNHIIWLSLGMMHAFVNMIFAVLTIFVTRRRIHDGILLTVTAWRLFFANPLYIVYTVYLLWEVVWMIVAAQKSAKEGSDNCGVHMNVQVGFYVAYLLAGVVAFVLTFATEGFRQPRWRRQANVNWYMKNEPEVLRQQGRGPSDADEEEATEMMSQDSLASDEPAATQPPSSSRRPSDASRTQARAQYEETRGQHLSPTGSRVGTRMRQLPSGALAWDAHDNDEAFTDNSTLRDSVGGVGGTPTERAGPLAPPPSQTQRQSSDRATSRSVHFRE